MHSHYNYSIHAINIVFSNYKLFGDDCLKKAAYYEKGDVHWAPRIETTLGLEMESGEAITDTFSLDRFT